MLLRPPNLFFLLSIHFLGFTPTAMGLPAPPANSREVVVLAPKLQKELGKALQALRDNKLPEAHKHLDAVYRVAPTDAETNFLLGVYSSQMNEWVQAKSSFENVLSLSPNHLGALLALGAVLVHEQKLDEAARYFVRAVAAEPTSWRAHAALADVYMRQGSLDDSIREAERALELGHGREENVLLLLARALQLSGDEQQAARVFQTYRQTHDKDVSTEKLFMRLPNGFPEPDYSDVLAALPSVVPSQTAMSLLSSNWMPPDIDEIVPPVEAGVSCNLDEILTRSGQRVQEFIGSVDQFTATEAVVHESINKFGLASHLTKFEFDYLVSIKENRPGLLSVDEYRNFHYRAADFPDGIATTGLAALMLIFHPYYAEDFSMTCEGLAHSKGQRVWQVYFRQRPDKPSVIRSYQVGGPQGRVYAVSLKGRAWIATDTFQILRMETDIVKPLPQIRLVADRAAIEYGPVHFQTRNLDLWLPQTAEVFYDWKGRRSHRRHSFGNYLLYSVDDKQQITNPSATAPGSPESIARNVKPKL
jgi:tetratricopeptide (TPR) repeat protein